MGTNAEGSGAEMRLENLREVSREGVWSVSSCKAGYGVEQLLDDNTETYWQSDGPQPHRVNIQFRRKIPLSQLSMFVDFKSDESYTPSRFVVRAGSNAEDLRDIRTVDLPQEPSGWQTVDLTNEGRPIKAFMVQLAVLQNHQNGRDTHIRQVKLHGPDTETKHQSPRLLQTEPHSLHIPDTFTTVEINQHSTIR